MFQCNRSDLTSSSTVTSAKRYEKPFSHQKNVWEHRFHTFQPQYNPGHVRSTICRENGLGFQSLWLGFRIRAYGQGIRSTFKLSGSVFRTAMSNPNGLLDQKSCH